MRGRVLAIVGVLLGLLTAAGAAPHFQRVDASVEAGGVLVVAFDERGLGNGDVSYVLTAVGTADYACLNRGGNHPQAANKETVSTQIAVGDSFEAKNGRVVASLSAEPPGPGDFACPSGQRLVLVAVSYTQIVLTDTTNGVAVTVPDVARVFLEL